MPRWDAQGKVIEALQGDITEVVVDAIVNAANSGLRGGGGVDGAIHRKGGPAILAECRRLGHCPTGQAVITTAGELPARAVIHAVGPVWRGGEAGEEQLLASAYQASLRLAAERGFESIAFPSISTGAYGFPIAKACPIAVESVLEHLTAETSLERVLFVLFSAPDLEHYRRVLEEKLGPPSDS